MFIINSLVNISGNSANLTLTYEDSDFGSFVGALRSSIARVQSIELQNVILDNESVGQLNNAIGEVEINLIVGFSNYDDTHVMYEFFAEYFLNDDGVMFPNVSVALVDPMEEDVTDNVNDYLAHVQQQPQDGHAYDSEEEDYDDGDTNCDDGESVGMCGSQHSLLSDGENGNFNA
jgi:hypothetical protein